LKARAFSARLIHDSKENKNNNQSFLAAKVTKKRFEFEEFQKRGFSEATRKLVQPSASNILLEIALCECIVTS